jgi:hypothetical protein
VGRDAPQFVSIPQHHGKPFVVPAPRTLLVIASEQDVRVEVSMRAPFHKILRRVTPRSARFTGDVTIFDRLRVGE